METKAIGYELVRFYDGQRMRRIFLRVTSADHGWLRGYEVDSEGEEIVPPGFDYRFRIIQSSSIVSRRPCTMDRKYGVLIPARRR